MIEAICDSCGKRLCAEERRIVIRADGFPDDIVARVVHSGTRVCVKLFHSEAVHTSTSTGWVEPPPRKEAGE